jgi:hypothetical protein
MTRLAASTLWMLFGGELNTGQREDVWTAACEDIQGYVRLERVASAEDVTSLLPPGAKETILGEVANLFGQLSDQDTQPVSEYTMWERARDYCARRILGVLVDAGGLSDERAAGYRANEAWLTQGAALVMSGLSERAGDTNLGEIVADAVVPHGPESEWTRVRDLATSELAVELAQRAGALVDAGMSVRDALDQNVDWLLAREQQMAQSWASGGRIYQAGDVIGMPDGGDLWNALNAGRWVEVDGQGVIVRIWDAQGREYDQLGNMIGGQ